MYDDEIVKIEEIDEIDLIDIEVSGDHLFYANGILTHNSSVEAQGEFDHSHIAGGISKINTADNVIAIHAPSFMKEKGEMDFIFLKTRSSSAVGQKIKMHYDTLSMRITDHVLSDIEEIETEKPTSIKQLKEETSAKLLEAKPTATPPWQAVTSAETLKPDVDMTEKNPLSKLAGLMVRSRNDL